MKKLITTLAIVLATVVNAEPPTITGVTAQQRYPWNGKVDIAYTVTGDIAAEAKARASIASLKVMAIDMVANTTNVATQLSGDASLAAGTHAIVWDMDAEGLSFKSSNVVFTVSCETGAVTYCVIDLSGGANATSYPVTYLASPPSGGFNVDVYKTTKLVLRRIEAGAFKMGGSTSTTLSKPFFCGIFEVTQGQWELVMGSNPCSSTSYGKGNGYPVHYVSYDAIRGSKDGANWPFSSSVDSFSFLGKLRTRTGLDFDLPTEAQWEYACRAGTTTTYSYGDSANGDYMWYSSNSGLKMHVVGTKPPNAWGLYDMHGNGWEWCLDSYSSSLEGGTDPQGPNPPVRPYSANRVVRGGSFASSEATCTSSYRSSCTSWYTYHDNGHALGFRISCPLQ